MSRRLSQLFIVWLCDCMVVNIGVLNLLEEEKWMNKTKIFSWMIYKSFRVFFLSLPLSIRLRFIILLLWIKARNKDFKRF